MLNKHFNFHGGRVTKTLVMLLIGVLVGSQLSFAQSKGITLKADNMPIEAVLQELKAKYGLSFVTKTEGLNLSSKVTVNLYEQDLKEAIKAIFSPQSIDVTVLDNIVKISAAKSRVYSAKGIVTDTAGEIIPGATIIVKGTGLGTSSSFDGSFSIDLDSPATLVCMCLGYSDQEENVSISSSNVRFVMSTSSLALEDAVVVGYGTLKKANLTGAVAVVDSEEIAGRSASNLSNLLQGLAPNVNVTTGSGRPGEGASINIRGIGSISGSAGPLVLVDGFEASMDQVNPNDVESISVLKDASAAAIYGARAAYGVILITTKKATSETVHLNYSGNYSFGAPTTSIDFEDRGYYHAAIIDMFYSTYQGSNYTTYTDEEYRELYIRRFDKTEDPERPWVVMKDGRYRYYANFDWYDYYFDHTKPTQNHDVSIYGKAGNTSYRISGGYRKENGIQNIGHDDFTKYNFRSKIDTQVRPWLKVGNNTAYYKDSYFYSGPSGLNNQFASLQLHHLASIPPTNPDGTFILGDDIHATGVNGGNGRHIAMADGGHNNEDVRTTFSTIFDVVLTPVKGLTITADYEYQHQSTDYMNRSSNLEYSRVPGVTELLATSIGVNSLYEGRSQNWYQAANLYANYTNTFAEKHNLTVMAGGNYETRFYKDMGGTKYDLVSNTLNDLNLATGEQITLTGGKNRYAIMGFFYRLNYDYMGKYLFEASGRYDGSSRFAKGRRWGYFPSASLGWRVDKEDFFAPAKDVMSSLKIRASYGSLGNQQVGYYDYIQTVTTGSQLSYLFGGDEKPLGATVSTPNADDFTWEVVTSTNAGVDMGFLNDRLTVSADYYIRDTDGMLMASKDLPSVYGASSPKTNAASLRTNGWEAMITWKDQFMLGGKPFQYELSGTLADNRTIVTKYNNDNKTLGTPYEGMNLGEMWGYVVDGLFETDEDAANYYVDQTYVNSEVNTWAKDTGLHAGDLRYVDVDGDGVITPTLNANELKDQRIIGNSLPRYTFSGRLAFNWNGIDFSTFIQGVGKQDWYPHSETYLFWFCYSRPFASFVPKDFLSWCWSEDNPDAYFPRPRGYSAFAGEGGKRALTQVNTRYIQNARYARIKNVTLGYTFPSKWMDKADISKLRVYFSGENLFYFSPLKKTAPYVDPGIVSASNTWSSGQTKANVYPMNKTFTFGIDLTF